MQERLSRREREKLRQREEILQVALRLFSEKGYHNVSMHEIAAKAEFAIGTLYKFFRNKEDLYRSLMLEQCDRFEKVLTEAIEETKGEVEKLRSYVKAKGRVFMENASIIRLYFAETRGASFNIKAGLDTEIRERYKQFIFRLGDVIEKGMKRGVFNKIASPRELAMALDSVVNAYLFRWLEDPELHPYPEDPDEILNIFFKPLLREEILEL